MPNVPIGYVAVSYMKYPKYISHSIVLALFSCFVSYFIHKLSTVPKMCLGKLQYPCQSRRNSSASRLMSDHMINLEGLMIQFITTAFNMDAPFINTLSRYMLDDFPKVNKATKSFRYRVGNPQWVFCILP